MSEENSTIKELRARIDTLNATVTTNETEKVALAAKVTELERAKLDETERLRQENADLATKATAGEVAVGQVASYQELFKTEWEALIAAAPEDKRATLTQISSHGDWPERIRCLKAGLSLGNLPIPGVTIGSITQPVPPATAPPSPTPTPVAQTPWDPTKGAPSWSDSLKKPGTPVTT